MGQGSAPTPDQYGQGCWFKVQLQGGEAGQESWFMECDGLEVTVDAYEYRQGGEQIPMKRPCPPRYANITLKRGVSASKKLFAWINSVAQGFGEKKLERVDGRIALCDRAGNEIIVWNWKKGWPCRYQGPRLNAQQGGLAIECIEIAHEGLEIEA
ncbi:MAG: phage tail protein [Planctomycetota bacterium]|nr:MAG: phage tail protein [Planctomycetota bacterium]